MSFVRRRIVKRLDLLNLVSILLLILNPSFNLIVTSCKCKYKWIISLLSRSFVFDVKRGIQWDTFLCEFRLSDEWRKCFDGRALDSGYVQLTVNHSRLRRFWNWWKYSRWVRLMLERCYKVKFKVIEKENQWIKCNFYFSIWEIYYISQEEQYFSVCKLD